MVFYSIAPGKTSDEAFKLAIQRAKFDENPKSSLLNARVFDEFNIKQQYATMDAINYAKEILADINCNLKIGRVGCIRIKDIVKNDGRTLPNYIFFWI